MCKNIINHKKNLNKKKKALIKKNSMTLSIKRLNFLFIFDNLLKIMKIGGNLINAKLI